MWGPPKDLDINIRIEEVTNGFLVTGGFGRAIFLKPEEVTGWISAHFNRALQRKEYEQKRLEEWLAKEEERLNK